MPLPKALPKKASKAKKRERMTAVMDELTHGPVTAPSRKATSGAPRSKQNIAIALKNSGQSRPHKKASKKK